MASIGLDSRIYGVNFESVREALVSFFFKYEGITKEELDKARGYVIPMQNNFMQPITNAQIEEQDTWIQYWIDNDDRIAQDYSWNGVNEVEKVARITVRFLGTRAESWAKSFHHLAGRKSANVIWRHYCRAEKQLYYVHPIIPTNVNYFGVGNTTLAFTLSFNLHYYELLDFRQVPGEEAKRLMYIGVVAGEMNDPEAISFLLDNIDKEADGED
jgi:hypothetical protein